MDQPPSRTLPFLLSLVAGTVDTVSFLSLSRLFASHVTGNLVILAASLASAHPQGTIGKLLSVPVFSAAVALAALSGEALRRWRISPLRGLLAIETVFLAIALAVAEIWPPHGHADSPRSLLLGGLLIVAMGVQNALNPVARPKDPPSTVLTSNLSQLVADLARLSMPGRPRDPGWASQAHALLWPVIGFSIGCALGAVGVTFAGLTTLTLPLVLVGSLAVAAPGA